MGSTIEASLGKFETITLDQMDRVKLMNRVDTKFNFTKEQLLSILPKLSAYYQVLDINGNLTPKYESLYYDDPLLTFYKDHHSKTYESF